MKSSTSHAAIVAFAAAFSVAAGLWAYEVWKNRQWKALVHAYAVSDGKTRAKQDFLDGKLQLYAIYEPDGSAKPPATNEGPFQILSVSYNPNVFKDRYTSEAFIQGYNQRMRFLHEHPERSIIQTNPQGPIK